MMRFVSFVLIIRNLSGVCHLCGNITKAASSIHCTAMHFPMYLCTVYKI